MILMWGNLNLFNEVHKHFILMLESRRWDSEQARPDDDDDDDDDNMEIEICQYESGGTFFVGFIIEYLEKLNAIILIIYSSRSFNTVCEHQVFALRGSD